MLQSTLLRTEQTEPVLIVEYQPLWPAAFESLREQGAVVLSSLAIAIEHVGSTAVPGLCSKPIIDLDVVVRAEDVRAAISALETLGYQHLGDLGVPGREAFRSPVGAARHHRYVCAEESPALRSHLLFRDYLRAHPDAAREYGELKTDLAVRHEKNRPGYTEAKSEFIESVLKRAV
jgi:GrpB-like predicted nucleotidyltransferase (UPF0157 family)